MMKRLSKVAMLFCFLAIASSAFAQKHDYPRYGFWSNWGIGVFGSFNWQPDAIFSLTGDSINTQWGKGFDAGLGIMLEKPINNVWAFRMRINWPSMATAFSGDSVVASIDRKSVV